jgi:hypothetical protein
MTVLRRLLLMLAIMFWQGGFTFYGAVVVPIGSDILGSHFMQGLITRSVTTYLNLAGVVALFLWGLDIALAPTTGPNGSKVRFASWGLLALTLGLQAWLHVLLDAVIDPEEFTIIDPTRFHYLHSAYLIASTIQWASSIVLAALTLWAWRDVDGRPRPVAGRE